VSTSSQVSGAQGGVSGAQAGIEASRQQFEAAKSQVAEAEANNTKAQNDLLRYKMLIDKQEISQQQYDQAVDSAQAAAAALQAARANADAYAHRSSRHKANWSRPTPTFALLATGRTRCGHPGPRPVCAGRGRSEEGALDQAELNLQYTKVIAPVSGAVSNRTVEVGQNCRPGRR